MMQGRKVISLLLVLALCAGLSCSAYAENLSDARKKAEDLKEQQEDVKAEQKSLKSKLSKLAKEMEECEEQIEEKEDELEAKEEELYIAQANENDQYESMKLRIKYMYESGNAQFVEILCESKSMNDFLNNAEYVQELSAYDREQLVAYQEVREEVEEQKESIEEEYEELEELQNTLIEKRDEVETLMDEKASEIAALSEELKETNAKIKKMEEAAAAAARKQAEKSSGYSAAAGASVVSGNGTFTHPCPGYSRISSTFGYRTAPKAGASTNHKGVDFAAATGTPIYAAAAGTVTTARYSGNAGNLVIINHGNGLQTYYMHTSKMYVKEGQKVEKGQNIAAVGTTGNSTGPHLHFQVMLNGCAVNPMSYL